LGRCWCGSPGHRLGRFALGRWLPPWTL